MELLQMFFCRNVISFLKGFWIADLVKLVKNHWKTQDFSNSEKGQIDPTFSR